MLSSCDSHPRPGLPRGTSAPHGFRPAAGFTLIELLVVLAVIAVLAALLMTSLTAVRRRGETVQCASNLRQIGAGMNLYVADHDGFLPGPLLPGQSPDFGPYAGDQQGPQYACANLASFLAPYLGLTGDKNGRGWATVFSCPAMARQLRAQGIDPKTFGVPEYYAQKFFYTNVHSYYYTDRGATWKTSPPTVPFGVATQWSGGSGGYNTTPLKMVRMTETSPSLFMALSDIDNKGNTPVAPNIQPMFGASCKVQNPVHGNFRNQLFFDGHVEAVPIPSPSPTP